MSWFTNVIESGVDKVVDSVANGLDNLFTSDEERLKAQNMLEQIRNGMKSELIQAFTKITKMQGDIIVAETNGESWLQRNWRPALMALFGFIIANEYVVQPYVQIMFDVTIPVKPITQDMWDLLKLGVGGYISALGVKKVVESSKWSK